MTRNSTAEILFASRSHLVGTKAPDEPSAAVPDLATTYLERAKECRRLASEADDAVLIAYLTELAEGLEEEAGQLRLRSPPAPSTD